MDKIAKTRIKRTPAEIAAAYRKLANKAEAKGKNMERQAITRRKIILGGALLSSVDDNAVRLRNQFIESLTRNHDRLAFGLEPLPGTKNDPLPGPDSGTGDQLGAEPPVADTKLWITTANDRLAAAAVAWNESQSSTHREELVRAIFQWEEVHERCWDGLQDRKAFGFSDRPGKPL